MGAIGSVWSQPSWADNVWQDGTWANAFVPPTPSGRDIGPGWPISDLLEESSHAPIAGEHRVTVKASYRIAWSLTARASGSVACLSLDCDYPMRGADFTLSATVDRSSLEEEAFLLGLFLGED